MHSFKGSIFLNAELNIGDILPVRDLEFLAYLLEEVKIWDYFMK